MKLNRGQRIGLVDAVDPSTPFALGVSVAAPGSSVDFVCFGLDADGRLADDRYMTFYNQPETPCGGVGLAAPGGDRDGFAFDLQRIPDAIHRLVLVAVVDGDATLSDVLGGHVRFIQAGLETMRFEIRAEFFVNEKAAMLTEFYRRQDAWRVSAVAQGFDGGLAAVVNHFGGTVDQEASKDERPPRPPLTLLAMDDLPVDVADDESSQRAAQVIETTLKDFKVGGRIVSFEAGPVVTTFAVEPAPGVKVSRIVGLEAEMSLALTTPGVRISALPGQGVVGIEVPNRKRTVVPLRRILEASEFKAVASPLALPLGVDPAGRTLVVDLQGLPHLLVTGTTGSGKSVALNTMVCSFLLRATHEEVRLILVDPKQLELSVYNGVPHLLAPVITDMNQCEQALKWAIREMMARYRRMAALGVRNLEGYSERIAECSRTGERPLWPENHEQAGQPVPLDPIPLLVIVIDELADLIIQTRGSVEDELVRLAQMGRAAGLHLILATQRPSREVLTGLIKANFPTRLTFRVSSKVDSRIILDAHGAETLQGHGDGLLLAPGQAHLQRLLAPLVTESEVQALVRFLKAGIGPQPDKTLVDSLVPREVDPADLPTTEAFDWE